MKPLFVLILLASAPAFGAGGDVVRFGDCELEVPKGARAYPQQSWYDVFRQNFGENGTAAEDQNRWRAKESGRFDTCAAFKLLMGICWKESGLNPNAGPGADAIPSPGMCQIQQRNCDGVGVRGNLNDPHVAIECAARIMKKNMEGHGCITEGADQRGNGRCLTNWSVMICKSTNPKVGHREEIREYQSGDQSCQ
jgi:hypothetical protein